MNASSSASPEFTGAIPAKVKLIILVAALGYFVDVYDLILFNVVRITSLKDLGIQPEDMLEKGILLLNVQNGGLLVGGILWGVIGDKRGRLSVLFGSIVVYSLANFLNGFVTSVPMYGALRFLAGIGLAGELGAGITLIAETMPPKSRGYGTIIVACAGMAGGFVGALLGDLLTWRWSYWVGGGLGALLLLLRIGVFESGIFAKAKNSKVQRGNPIALFWPVRRGIKYVSLVLVGLPVWLTLGILIAFSPEITRGMGMTTTPSVGRCLLFWYVGMFMGDLGSGLVSQWLASRKKTLGIWLVISCVGLLAYFSNVGSMSTGIFYAIAWLLGLSSGYWAMFVATASESFGTNLRATVTTSAPNFVRGGIILLTSGFKVATPFVGVAGAATVVSIFTLLISALALQNVEETFGRDLDYLEE